MPCFDLNRRTLVQGAVATGASALLSRSAHAQQNPIKIGFAMSLTEVLLEVQSLSRLDKIRLIQVLAQDLERADAGLIESGRSYPVWSPDRAFTAAAALLQALEEDKAQP